MPVQILGLYTNDVAAVQEGVEYLRIYALSFLPVAVTSILSAYLRCVQAAKIPLYAGIGNGSIKRRIAGSRSDGWQKAGG